MNSNQIREAFLEYFESRGHTRVPSSSLVPGNDPTLLFTNAGMVQFKELFLGQETRDYVRAASSQRCVRAGGKHNDLENVGYTARHHTFFEMLGNFSFGDYFKQEAIHFAWEFLTETLQVPSEKLWITVFEEDDEAADIWLNDIGVSKERFSRCGEKDNFWAMGDTGPCGPCSEIFYDHGESVPGGPPGSPDQEGDRYVEIWNLVFTQYDRSSSGELVPIPKPSVDTGMGLERISAVMQGVHNNYDIDLFAHIIKAIQSLSGNHDDLTSARVIADHIRSCAFLVADGVLPSNEGRGYVLRRIIRRAIRHGNKLGFDEPFFHRLVSPLADVMGDAYPELRTSANVIENHLQQEELRFGETLQNGLKHFEDAVAATTGNTIAGTDIFKLYDTYGFPVDLTADMARERGLELDMQGFDKAMEQQRQRGRAASKFDMEMSFKLDPEADYTTEFNGYEQLQAESNVKAIYQEGGALNELKAGETGGIILEATPFYAESGGQVGDQGILSHQDNTFQVMDTQKQGNAHIHVGEVTQGSIKVGDKLVATVNQKAREDTVRNHSATHLMHAALREILDDHVTQKGSLVAPDRLRFDFSHPDPVTKEQLRQIEDLVNHKVMENIDTKIEIMPLEEAKQSGAMSLFGEKYDDMVRVLTIGGEFSVELCGGTHVARSGDVGLFKIISETGIAAGVRRIEAVTGAGALVWLQEQEARMDGLADMLKSSRENILAKLEQQLERTRKLEKEVEQLKSKFASSAGDDMLSQAEDVNGIKVLATSLEGIEPKNLRDMADQLKNKLGTAALVLATVEGKKISLVAGVTKDATDRIQAGELVNFVATQVGGKGGGRPDMAQGGGNEPDSLGQALASVVDWVKDRS